MKSTTILTITAVISAFLLAFVYKNTNPIIEKVKKEKLKSALMEVFPGKSLKFQKVIPDTLYEVLKDGKKQGIIFINGKRGYSSVITTIVGVSNQGKITGIHILKESLRETPGLGMKVREKWFQKQFQDKNESQLILKKDNKVNGTLDAITSATISSRAVVNAVKEGIEKYKVYLEPSGNAIEKQGRE